MTNRTSPAVRLTPAAYLLGLFFALVTVAAVAYVQDYPFVYIVALPAAVATFLIFGEQAQKYGKF